MKIKNNILFLILILISTLVMGIGYASINSITGEITGTAIAEAQTGVFITDVIYVSNVDANSKTSEIQNYIGTMMKSRIELSEVNDSSQITYKVILYNNSNCEYGFEGVIYGDEYYDNKNIVFSISGINEGDIIKPKEEKEITITFKYKDGKISENSILNSYLNFKFTTIYRIAINLKVEKFVKSFYMTPVVFSINVKDDGKIVYEDLIDFEVESTGNYTNTINYLGKKGTEMNIVAQYTGGYELTSDKVYTTILGDSQTLSANYSITYNGHAYTSAYINLKK